MIFIVRLLVSFCSIAYELLLAQSLAAFRHDTVLCYSLAIGLYLLTMSLGAAFIGRDLKNPLRTLWLVQMALVLFGVLSIVSFFFIDRLQILDWVLWGWGYLAIAAIGVLTGKALRLLSKIAEDTKGPSQNAMLGADCTGFFFGSLAFVFLFYPLTGIVQALFFVASLNALCGVMIQGLMVHEGRGLSLARVAQIALLGLILAALVFAPVIEVFFIKIYIA